MTNNKTLKLFIPYGSQFRALYQKTGGSLKKQSETHLKLRDSQEPPTDGDINERETPAEEPLEEAESC